MVVTDEDVAAVGEVLRSGVLANGPEAAALEEAFADYCGVNDAVAVSSGTSALVLAGLSTGLERGAVVAVPSLTFAASANAFLSIGCRVVPVDVDETTMNIDVQSLEATVDRTPGVAAVVVVDLFGSTAGTDAAIDWARQRGLVVIEDAAQAHGALDGHGKRVGGRADVTTFSLYATKNVAGGEGGLVTAPAAEVLEMVRRLRNHGGFEAYRHELIGLNHRITEVSAVLARFQLERLEDGNAVRRRNAAALAEWCVEAWDGDVAVPPEASNGAATHVFHQFTVRFRRAEQRARGLSVLHDLGIDARHFYPYVIGELPGVEAGRAPTAESLRDRVMSLPVHPALTDEQLMALRDGVLSTSADVRGA